MTTRKPLRRLSPFRVMRPGADSTHAGVRFPARLPQTGHGFAVLRGLVPRSPCHKKHDPTALICCNAISASPQASTSRFLVVRTCELGQEAIP